MNINWAPGRGKIETSIYEGNNELVNVLISSGFYQDGHESNVRSYALQEIDLSYELPKGITIISFS